MPTPPDVIAGEARPEPAAPPSPPALPRALARVMGGLRHQLARRLAAARDELPPPADLTDGEVAALDEPTDLAPPPYARPRL